MFYLEQDMQVQSTYRLAKLNMFWLPSLLYREEIGDHRHFGQGYMNCVRNTSGLSPKVFRMLWLDRRALVESSDSIAG